MHAALDVDEILRNVINDSDLSKRDLAAIATACRAWSDPALDELWESLDSLGPLFNALPDGLLEWEYSPGDKSTLAEIGMKMTRPFLSSDWAAFRRYSSRVRAFRGSLDQTSITWDGWTPATMVIAEDLFSELAAPNTPDPLFPRLREVMWYNAHINNAKLLHLLLVPSVKTLHMPGISVHWFSVFLQSVYATVLEFFASLGDLCPSMKSFHSPHNFALIPDASSVLSPVIRSWKHLESITCTIPDFACLEHFSSLSSLRHLQLHVPKEGLHIPNSVRFGHLDTLCLSGSPGDMVNLLSAIDGPLPISRFESQAFQCPEEDDINRLLDTLLERCCPAQLKSLYIQEYHHILLPPIIRSYPFRVTLQALQPAASFHALERIYVDTPRAISLGDQDMLELVRAWPSARTLEINPNGGWVNESRVSLVGVASLLKAAPQLERLAVSVDARSLASQAAEEPSFAAGARGTLSSLDLLDSRVGTDYEAVASFMAGFVCAPGCDARAWNRDKVLSKMSPDAACWRERWRHVFELLGDHP